MNRGREGQVSRCSSVAQQRTGWLAVRCEKQSPSAKEARTGPLSVVNFPEGVLFTLGDGPGEVVPKIGSWSGKELVPGTG